MAMNVEKVGERRRADEADGGRDDRMPDSRPAQYEVLALKYATRAARRADLFIGGDPHDADAAMDYYLWVVRGDGPPVRRGYRLQRGHGGQAPPHAAAHAGGGARGWSAWMPDSVEHVIITHFHNDHVGAFDSFPNATFHVQDDEMDFATGRYMRHERFAQALRAGPRVRPGAARLPEQGRLPRRRRARSRRALACTASAATPRACSAVRVHTARGWVVLASDASHYYEHFEKERAFPLVFHVGDLLQGYGRLAKLADSPRHVVPGHDPLVMDRYPPPSDALRGIAVRLDAEPSQP